MALDKYQIRCGNCAELLKEVDSSSIDLILTSPPYDGLRDYEGYEFNFKSFEVIAQELYRVLKGGGVVIWVVADQTKDGSESGSSFRQALYFKDIGFRLHDTMIYQKINYIPLTHNRYEQSFEYMFCFSKGRPKTFTPIMIPCKGAGKVESYGSERRRQIDKNQAMRAPEGISYQVTADEKIHPNIFSYSCGTDKTGHPAPFPEQLCRDMIRTWTQEGDIVLDPFCGSATAGVAALKMGRKFIGFDISEKYCELSKTRLEPLSQPNIFDILDNGGEAQW